MNSKLLMVGLLLASVAMAADEETQPSAAADNAAGAGSQQTAELQAGVADGPKTMSGMSILGNEEAPKSLVIVPWKSSELGDDLSLNDSLDDRARPVDREVFLRELNYYEIRTGS